MAEDCALTNRDRHLAVMYWAQQKVESSIGAEARFLSVTPKGLEAEKRELYDLQQGPCSTFSEAIASQLPQQGVEKHKQSYRCR